MIFKLNLVVGLPIYIDIYHIYFVGLTLCLNTNVNTGQQNTKTYSNIIIFKKINDKNIRFIHIVWIDVDEGIRSSPIPTT